MLSEAGLKAAMDDLRELAGVDQSLSSKDRQVLNVALVIVESVVVDLRRIANALEAKAVQTGAIAEPDIKPKRWGS